MRKVYLPALWLFVHWFMFSPVGKNGSTDEGRKESQVKTRQMLPSREKLSGFVSYVLPDVRGPLTYGSILSTIAKITVAGQNWEHLF